MKKRVIVSPSEAERRARQRACFVNEHTYDCDFQFEQYWWECSCGALARLRKEEGVTA